MMHFSMSTELLDQLPDHLDEVVKALRELEDRVATVRFDAKNEESVTAAIQSVENDVDRRLLPFRANDLVQTIGGQFKERAAENIRLRAKQAASEQGSSRP